MCLHRDVISEFNSEIEGSLACCALNLFLYSILCLMCSGSCLHEECILPFGVLCLSARIMMFVKMAFAVAPNDTAYKRWSCHSGHKLLSSCVEPSRPQQ